MSVVDSFMAASPWISFVTSTAAAGAVGNLWIKSRRMRVAENEDSRNGFGIVIKVLRDEVDRLIDKHKSCEDRLTLVEAELRGVHRQMIANSLTAAVQIGSLSPEMQAAVDALARRLGEPE